MKKLIVAKGSKEGGVITERPEFRVAGGQTGRKVEKAGMGVGEEGMGRMRAEGGALIYLGI